MYFTNEDFVTVDGAAYTWHRIEVIGVDGQDRVVLVNDVEKPRGLYVTDRWASLKLRYNAYVIKACRHF